MTRKSLVTFLGCVVLVLKSVVIAEECPQGDSNGNCSLTTHNNDEHLPQAVDIGNGSKEQILPFEMNLSSTNEQHDNLPSSSLNDSNLAVMHLHKYEEQQGQADWSDYSPALLKTPTSKLLSTTKAEIEKLSTQEMMTHTPEPMTRPKSLNMLAEDSVDNVFRPTPNPSSESPNSTENSTEALTSSADEPKGRALNFTIEEENRDNILSNSSRHHNDFDLSDVTIHDDDFDMDYNSKILGPKSQLHNLTLGICEKGGYTYENGEKLEVGCESVCTCRSGKMDCVDRCSGPFFRKGKKIEDPLCSAKDTEDPCCSVLVCAGDTETEPLEICSYGNKTYNRGDRFNKECIDVCTCEAAGKIACKPRCLPINKTSDRCVEVPDPNDSCCKKVLCDVSLDEHDTEKEDEKPKQKLLSASYINTTTILLTFDTTLDESVSLPDIEVSNDKSNWKYYKLLPGGLVFVKNNVKYLKVENTDDIVDIQHRELGPKLPEELKDDCQYKGKIFKLGEEYNDDCESLCVCQEIGMKCLKIQCPTYFGVDVLDPNCVEWETVPPEFKASPPNCCPDKVRCKNNGSCYYEGRTYKNWDLLPSNVTGCERKCYCEMGKVECQNTCPPVTAVPPPYLPCPPNLTMISHIPDDDCCKYWVCNSENDASETVHNQTESDSKGQIAKNSTDSYMGSFAPKPPSKVLGPLAVYTNEDSDQNIANNSLGTNYKSKISPYENPFYHKSPLPHKPDITKSNFSKDKNSEYLGSFDPKTGGLNTKPSKDVKNKISNKSNSYFVTPPPLAEQSVNENVNYFPNYLTPPTPFLSTQRTPGKSEIELHSQSSPEEVLQFIHQYPEISNYPSGSILEFHNLPSSSIPKQPFNNQGFSTSKPKIHLVPYIVPQNSDGQPVNNDLPPGISLEQILQEFQKNSQALQNNPLSYLPNPHQYPGNNGLMMHPQQSGPLIPNRHNSTYSAIGSQMFPGNFPGFPGQHPQEDITIQNLDAIDPHKVRLAFTVPPVIVGLHGRVEVRYTHNKDEEDLDSWMLTVFAPPNDLIATPSLVFDLTDLKPDTEYRIKITVTLRDLHNTPSSKIYTIRTPKEAQPPVIPIDPDLAITDINATWVTVVWRAFTQYELQFIDGIQLRYKEIDGRIYTATPLIHRAITRYTLEKLKPNTKYEIGIYFIPFPDQMTELRAENILHFTTANEIDTYGFNVSLEISQIKSQSVEITWNGVPYPEDKYVNIYRAIYQSDSGKEDQSTFKIAKRDSPTKTVIMDLKPGTRYRLWLEVYLTNGKIKTSNVEDFITKPRIAPAFGASSQQDKLSRAEFIESKGDYYGPLIIVAILAAIAILSTLILLLILVRRHNQNKAAITPPSMRISQSAYDNPTYKVEIQQETMAL